MNRYHVLRTGERWSVVRRANDVNGNTVCLHDSRYLARRCCWGRNGNSNYSADICADHTHVFVHGGACKVAGCQIRCPHPIFTKEGTCSTCGCLRPLSGHQDLYEIPLGPPQPCLLGTDPSNA